MVEGVDVGRELFGLGGVQLQVAEPPHGLGTQFRVLRNQVEKLPVLVTREFGAPDNDVALANLDLIFLETRQRLAVIDTVSKSQRRQRDKNQERKLPPFHSPAPSAEAARS